MVDGVKIRMGGQDWIVPALNLFQMEKYEDAISSLSSLGTAATKSQRDTMIEIVHAAMSRNYKDVTLDQVKDLIDMNNLVLVVQAVMGQSGLVLTSGEQNGGSQ